MRARARILMAAALVAATGTYAGAQQSSDDRTPQGRPVAKAQNAAKEAGAAQSGGEGAAAQAAEPTSQIQAAPVLEGVEQAEEASVTGVGLTYDPGGRRDPFISPSELMEYAEIGQCEEEGIACWLISEVDLVGVMARASGGVALVIGPDGYGAALKAGDELYDGEVLRVDASRGALVFRQRVNDPTRIKPYRDIEKKLSMTREGGV